MENKTELLERLIKEGKITFAEALVLNETEKEIVAQPYPVYPQPIQPYPQPYNPIWPTYPWGTICLTGSKGLNITDPNLHRPQNTIEMVWSVKEGSSC